MPVVILAQESLGELRHVGPNKKHQCIFWDAALPCFGLRAHPSGRRSYVCSYRIGLHKRLAILGRADVLTLEQARQLAVTYLSRAAANQDPQGDAHRVRRKSVTNLCAAFIQNHAKQKRLSWKSDQSVLKRRIIPMLGTRRVSTIVSSDLEPIHTQLGAQHPYAANQLLDVVRAMFNWGRTAGLVAKTHPNPTAGIIRFRKKKRRRYLTSAEMPQFISALEAEDSEYGRHGLWLLLLMGVRTKDLLNAKWTDIDWNARTLFVGLTKNGEPLLAPISDAALARLHAIPRISGNPYIVCGRMPGRPLTGLGKPLKRVLARAGLQNVHVHDLRRTVGSWLAQSGVSLHLIGDVLNHLDLQTTLNYAYFETEQRRDVLTAYGNKVLSFATSHIRVSPQPKTLSVENVLRPKSAPSRQRHYFKRETLHDLVWTAPVLEVARRLGVSDVALAKLCRRASIPIPGRGYWARVEAGQQIGRTPLPLAREGLPSLLRIRGKKPVLPAVKAQAA